MNGDAEALRDVVGDDDAHAEAYDRLDADGRAGVGAHDVRDADVAPDDVLAAELLDSMTAETVADGPARENERVTCDDDAGEQLGYRVERQDASSD